MHSARLARRQGADDALLLARGHGVADDGPLGDRAVLDGPNFAVAWLEDKVLKVPCLRLCENQNLRCVHAIDATPHRLAAARHA